MPIGSSPPSHLNADTQRWFIHVIENFDLEQHHVRLLTLAAQAWDRAEQARKVLAKSGLTYQDRFGAPHPRPEVIVERDCRIAFARLLRELDLDAVAPPEASRPPLLRSNRR